MTGRTSPTQYGGAPVSRKALKALADEPWPRGVSREPTMNIGAVLSVLKREFPAVSHSKVRFLEDQGLVSPQRTPAGYRVFSAADVERLRFALAAQRDSFLPLRVIRERLVALDAGLEDAPITGEVPQDSLPARLSGAELAALVGISADRLADLDSAGLVSADPAGRYPATSLTVLQAAEDLAARGIDVRHLRLMRAAADRQVDVVAQIVAPLRGRSDAPQDAVAREGAIATARDLSELLSRLHSALVLGGVERLF